MAKRTPPDPGSSATRSAPGDRVLWVVPRRWLAVLVAVIVLPWLIAAAFFTRDSGAESGDPAVPRPSAAPAAAAVGDARPWGRLLTTPIVISPPLEYVPSNWGPIEPPRWHFPRATRAQVEQFFVSAGLSPQSAAQLLANTREDGGNVIVTPDPRLVRALPPDVRAGIYLQLARSDRNDRQRNAYRYFGTSSEIWLGHSLTSPQTRKAIEPYIYRIGDFVYFADIDLARSEIAQPAELQRLAKGLMREATMLVELQLDGAAQLEAAVEYWGRGGRRTDIHPLLESLVSGSGDRSIDISHLLPQFAREHLYRYPRVSLGDFDKPGMVNCFWTALNFFNAEPDDRYLDARVAIEQLKRDYFIVHDQFQFGDVAAFVDPEGNIFHAAVYLADGLVFGKNGTSHLSPWTIVPIDRLKGYYVEYADTWQVVFYRRKGF